jgi:hypothetical protein
VIAALAAPTPVTAAAPAPGAAVKQCNGTDNVGGQAVACKVTVTNNLDLNTGDTGSTVEVQQCHGAANAALTCTNDVTPSDQLTTSVDQCNGSGSGGGGTVNCEVRIVNNITGPGLPVPATIDQCNGSGAGGGTQPTVSCDPIGNTTDATITQCNDSGNGGGGTMRVKCTVTPSTESSALPVSVNQCNGSGNGGGATVTCTVSVTNNQITPPPVTPPPVTPPPVTPPPVTPPPVTPAVDTRVEASPLQAPVPVVSQVGASATPAPLAPTTAGAATVIASPVDAAPMVPLVFVAAQVAATRLPAATAAGTGAITSASTGTGGGVSGASSALGSRTEDLRPATALTAESGLAFTGSDSRTMVLLALLVLTLGLLAVRLSAESTDGR